MRSRHLDWAINDHDWAINDQVSAPLRVEQARIAQNRNTFHVGARQQARLRRTCRLAILPVC